MAPPVVLIDDPAPHVRRITLNRPEKRNALNHALRGGVLQALQEADEHPEVRVSIVRGQGSVSRRATAWAEATKARSCPSSPRGATVNGPAT